MYCAIQGCQMVCFQTKNPDLGKFYGHLEYITAIWWFSGILVYFPRFGKLNQEKSGNPAAHTYQDT
jgi:hypothetical protein